MTEVTINLNIAGRTYPLRVNPANVGNLKEAEKMINAKIDLYEKNFAVKDKQDLLAMCIINFASELAGKAASDKEYENLALQLKDTEQYLNNYLTKLVL
jgi:cell division protein ZapA